MGRRPRLFPATGELGPLGRLLCRVCRVEVTPPRRTFCSGKRSRFRRVKGVRRMLEEGTGCVHRFLLANDQGYCRKHVEVRDRGLCAQCGTVSDDWQADHDSPVAEGGQDLGLGNLRTLCLSCHKRETAKLAARRAARRRE